MTDVDELTNKIGNLVITQEETPKKKVETEDLGKIFEKAICLLYEIDYQGKFKYNVEDAEKLKIKIMKLKDAFPYKIKHTAINGGRYDYVCTDDETIKLSAKTTKKDGKVCPQVIGQPSKKKFCNYFELAENMEIDEIKKYIENNVLKMLDIYASTTFDCSTVYYNKHKNKLLLIQQKEKIDWSKYAVYFSHQIKNKEWNESSTINIVPLDIKEPNKKDFITIGEFQVHNKRDCIKFRWAFEKVIDVFESHFTITKIDLS